MITFENQAQKIIDAYMEDKIRPLISHACFIGNLLNTGKWAHCRNLFSKAVKEERREEFVEIIRQTAEGFYTPEDVIELEQVFMHNLCVCKNYTGGIEGMLFNAVCKGLDKLREIHESKGEDVKPPIINQRMLQTL